MRILSLLLLLLFAAPAMAQPLEQGSKLPSLPEGKDFSSLAGPNGLVLVVFRSADW